MEQNTIPRQNFREKDKKELALRAGNRCSINGCLAETTCIGDTDKSVVNHGVASHIHPASSKGPSRGEKPDDIDLDDISNGIWTCRKCADIIDKHLSEYSSKDLFEMKKVRETAQKMAVSEPLFYGLIKHISPLDYEKICWNHRAEFDKNKMHADILKKISESSLNRIVHTDTIPIPSNLKLKPIAQAFDEISREIGNKIPEQTFTTISPILESHQLKNKNTEALRIAKDIVNDIKKYFVVQEKQNVLKDIKLTAINTKTGEICDKYILKRIILTHQQGSLVNHEVSRKKLLNKDSILYWLDLNLMIDYKNETISIKSELSTKHFNFQNLNNDWNWNWWDEFIAHHLLLTNIAKGWQPIAFISKYFGDIGDVTDSDFYPEVLEITQQINPIDLEKLLNYCQKIKFALELRKKWKYNFIFTKCYFDDILDTELIHKASDSLWSINNDKEYSGKGQTLTETWQLCFIFDGQSIRFEFLKNAIFLHRKNIKYVIVGLCEIP